MASVEKTADGGSVGTTEIKQEPKSDVSMDMGTEADNQAEVKSGVEPTLQIKEEPLTPAKIKTEVVTPAKPAPPAASDTTEAAGDAKPAPKSETTGDSTGAKTEADSVLGLDVLVDDTMINDLDADLIGKSSAGTTDGKPKDEKQPETEEAKVTPAGAEDGATKDEATTEEDKSDKKDETKDEEKKPDGDDKSKRLVGFVCSLSLDYLVG